jgi:hypothetical protein
MQPNTFKSDKSGGTWYKTSCGDLFCRRGVGILLIKKTACAAAKPQKCLGNLDWKRRALATLRMC